MAYEYGGPDSDEWFRLACPAAHAAIERFRAELDQVPSAFSVYDDCEDR